VCAYFGNIEDPAQDGSIRVRQGDEGQPLETIIDADGCVTVELIEGIWQWQAVDESGECRNDWEEIAVDDCSTVVRSVDLSQWCLDGR
jgi:hypothetical protein